MKASAIRDDEKRLGQPERHWVADQRAGLTLDPRLSTERVFIQKNLNIEDRMVLLKANEFAFKFNLKLVVSQGPRSNEGRGQQKSN